MADAGMVQVSTDNKTLDHVFDKIHYFRYGYTGEELKKYKTINENDTDSDRIKKIEERVNEVILEVKSSNSIPSIARNAFIGYIVLYTLLAIIVILNIVGLLKKAGINVSSDSFTSNNKNNKMIPKNNNS
jgi:hypothetical protein